MNILPWQKVKPDPLRGTILACLSRLQTLFHARNLRFEFSEESTTEKLESALWFVLGTSERGLHLTLPPAMPAEARISAIMRALPPVGRPGTGQANPWPNLLQTAR